MTRFVRHAGLGRGFPYPDSASAPGFAVRPLGVLSGAPASEALAAGFGRAIAGGPLAFTACEAFVPAADGVHVALAPLADLLGWAARDPEAADIVDARLRRIAAPRADFAGLAMDRPRIVGIVNATPDSFSDGGRFADADAAVAHGAALIAAGADMIDIGGESSRPGARPVPEAEEIRRIEPVIRGLAGRGVPVSVDTRRAAVMRAALSAGATVVNDITALAGDPESMATAAAAGAAAILMHMQGEPGTMQDDPRYDHAPYEVWRYLAERVAACERAGIPAARLAVDPGIGFGKTSRHNMQILAAMALFHGTGCVVAAGVSRKISDGAPPDARLPGTLAATVAAAAQGAQLHRVHDVAEVGQALAVLARLQAGG